MGQPLIRDVGSGLLKRGNSRRYDPGRDNRARGLRFGQHLFEFGEKFVRLRDRDHQVTVNAGRELRPLTCPGRLPMKLIAHSSIASATLRPWSFTHVTTRVKVEITERVLKGRPAHRFKYFRSARASY